MSARMIYRGSFVFETKGDMNKALTFLAETELGRDDFNINGLKATIDFDGSGPYFVYEEMISALEEACDFAIGGSIECQFEDEEVWMIANKRLPYSAGFSSLMRDVIGEDFEGVEIARDALQTEQLSETSDAYAALSTWLQKSAMIQLLQEIIDPRTLPIMIDFLSAPACNLDDTIWVSKAIALCHIEGSFDPFRNYLDLGNLAIETEAARVLATLP